MSNVLIIATSPNSVKIFIKKIIYAIIHYKWINKILFIGEFFWHRSIREELKQELPYLKSLHK
jgi:hypothetical protein